MSESKMRGESANYLISTSLWHRSQRNRPERLPSEFFFAISLLHRRLGLIALGDEQRRQSPSIIAWPIITIIPVL